MHKVLWRKKTWIRCHRSAIASLGRFPCACFATSSKEVPGDDTTTTICPDSGTGGLDKPTTKSLLSEIIQQHRELRPISSSSYSPPNRRNVPSPLLKPILPGNATAATSIHSTISNSDTSLFDVFRLPDPPLATVSTVRGPDSYPAASMEQYYQILEPVLTSQKFRKKHTNQPVSDEDAQPVVEWLRLDGPALPCQLPTFQKALKAGVEPLQRGKERHFDEEVGLQRKRFYTHCGFRERQMKIASGAMFQVTNMCARNGKGLPLEVIWAKVKECGMTDKLLLHNLLYVSATFSTGSAQSRRKRRSKYGHLVGITSILDVLDPDTDDQGEDDDDIIDLTDEIAIYHDLLYEPTEQSINIRVRLLVAQGKAKEAERLLNEHSDGEADLRLRSYSPVLRLFLELGDFSSALNLYKEMQKMSTVHLDVETYIYLLAGFAEKGQLCVGAEPIENAKSLGYKCDSGPRLLDEIVEEMKSEVFEIAEPSAKRLYNAIASGFPDSGLSEAGFHSSLNEPKLATKDELLASRVRIDLSTGICPLSGVKLQLIQLTEDEKTKLIQGILSLAKSEYDRFHEKHKRWKSSGQDSADENLIKYYNWLDQREGDPFTILIDGANVGYYNQNFEDGRFSYHQIKFVVDYLEQLGENPLVVLPNKYARDTFTVTQAIAGSVIREQQLTVQEMAIRNDLWRREKLVRVPAGHLGKCAHLSYASI
jgi:pentatricopeptide repeat protein